MQDNPFTGVVVLYAEQAVIGNLFEERQIPTADLLYSIREVGRQIDHAQPEYWLNYPNVNLVIKPSTGQGTALGRLSPNKQNVLLLKDYSKDGIQGLKSRNKEQNMLLNALVDPEIPCVTVEGRAGSGKTICALAAAIEMLLSRDSTYEKVVLTRPMSAVGGSLGALPGTAEEKFLPYLGSYMSNFEYLLGKRGIDYVQTMVQKERLILMPIQLIGGISWHNSYIIADEVQSLTPEQMYALGTRPAEGSKLVLLGDSAQRYGRAPDVTRTGLWQLTHNKLIRTTPLVSYIKLIKQERSPLADIFYKVFVEDEDDRD